MATRLVRFIAILLASWWAGLAAAQTAAQTVTYTYSANGQVATATYYNGTTIVYTYDANGNRLSAVVTPDTTPPSAPRSETDSSITSDSATVSWTAATDTIAITGYQYQINGGAWTSLSGSTLSTPLPDLTPGTTYTVDVEAVDAAGNIGAATAVTFSTPPTTPGTPTASDVTGTTATVSWAAATAADGIASYSYQLNGGAWVAVGNVVSMPLTGLTYGTAYTVAVEAQDAAGTLSAVATGSFTTGPTTPGTPTASSITGSSATASWTASTDSTGITGYSYQVNGGAWSTFTSGLLSVPLTGLAYGTTYTVNVRSEDNVGNISATASGSFTTLSSAPGTPTASNIAGTSATVSWTAATGAFFYYYQVNGGAWSVLGNVLSVNLTGLTYGGSYTVNVCAVNTAGICGPIASGTFTTPPSTPGAPSISNIAGTSATVSWTAAADGSGITGYSYQVNGGSWSAFSNVLSVNLGGLAYGTNYTIGVRAEDAYNNIGPTATASFTTAPSAPGTPTAGSIGPTSATVSWAAATGSVGGYRYSVNGGSTWTTVGNVLSTSVSGLALGTAYTVLVEAENPAGNWGASSSGSFTTLSVYTDNLAFVQGSNYSGGGLTEYGYEVGAYGSLTPNTTSNGKAITVFMFSINTSTYVYYSEVVVTGFTANPGAGWLQSIATLTGTTATFSYNGTNGAAAWTWPSSSGAAISSGTLTVVHK